MNLLLPFTLLASLLPAQWIHPFHLPQPDAEAGEVWMVVEIPKGSINKFEIDKQTGHVVVDRTMSMPVAYPANYGTIASTYAEDGDNLDALVFTREALPPGSLIKVRVIGMLPMVDGGEQDDKLIAVPVSKVDPSYDSITDIKDLPADKRDRISAFFRVYKQLPEGRKVVELGAMQGREAATLTLNKALRAYADRAAQSAHAETSH